MSNDFERAPAIDTATKDECRLRPAVDRYSAPSPRERPSFRPHLPAGFRFALSSTTRRDRARFAIGSRQRADPSGNPARRRLFVTRNANVGRKPPGSKSLCRFAYFHQSLQTMILEKKSPFFRRILKRRLRLQAIKWSVLAAIRRFGEAGEVLRIGEVVSSLPAHGSFPL